MYKSVVVTIAMLIGIDAWSQDNVLTGAVRDESGHALVGATVQINELSRLTVTDEFGSFGFAKLPSGDYTLTIRFIGFEEKVEPVHVPSTAVSIAMTEALQVTDEVVVFATRANERTPTTYTNVSGLSLRKQNFGQDMPMLLNWTPSVTTTSDAGGGVGYTGIRIRGTDATRINVTINGISYNDSESQGTYWVDIPDVASSTQSVQIQRGVGTSTNGAGAFGGSVNVQTLSQQRDPYAEALMGFGSFNTQRLTLRAGTGLIDEKWTFDARVSKIKSDGYIDRAASDLTSYYFSGGYYGKKTILKAIAFGGHENTYQAWNGNDAETMKTDRTFNSAGALYDGNGLVTSYYDNQVDDYRQDHYQLHLTQELGANWNANVSAHYTYGRGYYEVYEQDQLFADKGLPDITLGTETISTGDFIVRKWLDNHFYGTTFSFNYDHDKTNLTIGGAYNRYSPAKHFGEIIWAEYAGNVPIRHHYYEGRSEKDDGNLYAKVNYDLSDKLNFFADLQWRNVQYQTKGIDEYQSPYDVNDTFNFLNPKAGLTYSISSGNLIHVSYAVANREPNRTDYLSGTTKPKPERLGNLELGWDRSATRCNVGVNYYLMNYDNQLVLTGELDQVGNPIRANVGKSYRTGIELTALWKVLSNLSWNVNGTWSVNRNLDYIVINESGQPEARNTAIILSPGWIGGSQLSWTPFQKFSASLLTKYVGKQFLDNTQNNSLALDPYLVNDLRFTYTFETRLIKGIDLSLLVNNIFNTMYSSNGYVWDGYAYYYPQAGTNFLAMVGFRF